MIIVKNVSTFACCIKIDYMRISLKNGLYLLGFSILVSIMASCFSNNNDDIDIALLTDAEILNFYLSHDSLPELENVVFSIEQRGAVGLIYNYDSMAYLTEIPEKVVVYYISGMGSDNVLNITNGDSILLKSGDSIDISVPQTLKVYALDGKTTKIYNTKLNIHQIDPDSVQFYKIASEPAFLKTEDTKTIAFNNKFLTYSRIEGEIQLYTSSDAVDWKQESFSGLPDNAVIRGIQSKGNALFACTDDGELYVRYDSSIDEWISVNKPPEIKVKSILGYKNGDLKYSEGLCLVVETGGISTFAFTGDLIKWDYDSILPTPVPEDFPIYEFSNHSYKVMQTERITVFGGISLNGETLNTVWSTENGLYWAKLSTNSKTFPLVKGANVFFYNKEFWMINGKSDEGFNNKVYSSIDGGVTWAEREEKCQAPEEYLKRYNASVVLDKNNKSFYIIGGKNNSALPEIWKGFINKSNFEH